MTAPKEERKKYSLLSEIINVALIAAFIVLPIRLFVAQPFIVSGSSMDPTFSNGDYLIIDQLSYRLGEPDRGDVVIFRYPYDPSKFFIKRVIGLPGETVQIEGGQTIITGGDLDQPYIFDESFITYNSPGTVRVELSDEEYFVMGDNRPASSDSRSWGALHRDNIIGRAFMRLLPVDEVSFLPGDVDPPPRED